MNRWWMALFPLVLWAGPYESRDYSFLIGMQGFQDSLLKMHFQLYEGYVKQANDLSDLLQQEPTGPTYGALKRRFEWEFNGMRLHELYFSNLGGEGKPDRKSALIDSISRQFGSYDSWKKDFLLTGGMRGIGWAILYYDPVLDRLMNTWIEEHDTGHPALAAPLLVMDVFEHAYISQYGLDRAAYIEAFFQNINWDEVSARYDRARAARIENTP